MSQFVSTFAGESGQTAVISRKMQDSHKIVTDLEPGALLLSMLAHFNILWNVSLCSTDH